ncbi:MAG: hypothetical protein OIF54_03205, partial [Cohaesibacter sp.]|nr:hypothetical protein [Cohaesibacter sp.]
VSAKSAKAAGGKAPIKGIFGLPAQKAKISSLLSFKKAIGLGVSCFECWLCDGWKDSRSTMFLKFLKVRMDLISAHPAQGHQQLTSPSP